MESRRPLVSSRSNHVGDSMTAIRASREIDGKGQPEPRLRPYRSYRNACLDWLDRIPSHWELKRLKFSTVLNPSAAEARSLPGTTEVSFVPMEAVGEYDGLDLSRIKPLLDVASGYTFFGEGDVVIAKITPCFENGKGALANGLTNGIAFGTTELHVLRSTREIDKEFLFYVTLSDAFRRLGEAEMYGAGGQKRVPESFIEDFLQPLPPIPEQRAIACTPFSPRCSPSPTSTWRSCTYLRVIFGACCLRIEPSCRARCSRISTWNRIASSRPRAARSRSSAGRAFSIP